MIIPTGSIKICEECDSVYAKIRGGAAAWLKRRFCSNTCTQAARSKAMLASLPIATAFWNRVNKTNACWLWRGSKYGDGYGRFNYAGQNYRAHAIALKLDGRPIPKGKQGLHHCDNKLCVRPSHLYVGTQKNNTDDIWNRSRHPSYGVQHPLAKLTPEAVLEMRWMRRQGIPFDQIGCAFNVAKITARDAVLGKTWKRSVSFNSDDLADLKKIRAKRPRLPDALILKKSLRRRQRQDRQRRLEAENAP